MDQIISQTNIISIITLILSIITLFYVNNVQSVPCINSDTLYYCVSLSGIELDTEEACVEESQLCDSVRDCPFGDDEWNCNDNNGAECTEANGYYDCILSPRNEFLPTTDNTTVCIRNEYACDNEFDTWDCPNQEDLDPSICPSIRSPCLDDDDPLNFLFYECEVNNVCIFSFWVCNDERDCLDGQDERNSTCDTLTPTIMPTAPTGSPSAPPTNAPSSVPSDAPSNAPSNVPSNAPSNGPSGAPSNAPTNAPSNAPSGVPSNVPSNAPSSNPSDAPTNSPTRRPTNRPTATPSVGLPTTKEPTRPSCWWTNYRGGGGRDGDDGCDDDDDDDTVDDPDTPTSVLTNNPSRIPTAKNPTEIPTYQPSSEPTRPSDWWTNYRGGSSSRS